MPGKTRLLQVGACVVIAATTVGVLLTLTPTTAARVSQLNITSTQPAFVVNGTQASFGFGWNL